MHHLFRRKKAAPPPSTAFDPSTSAPSSSSYSSSIGTAPTLSLLPTPSAESTTSVSDSAPSLSSSVHEDPVVARAEDTKPTEAATAAGDDNVNGSGTSTQVATREPGAAQVAGSENWFLTPILNTIAAPFMALAPLLVFMVAPPLALIMAFTTLSRKTWQNMMHEARPQ